MLLSRSAITSIERFPFELSLLVIEIFVFPFFVDTSSQLQDAQEMVQEQT